MHDIFGIESDPKTARVHILPVPYDATTSYKPGAARGPKAVLDASVQVDLCDADVGGPHEAGIYLHEVNPVFQTRNSEARAACDRIHEAIDSNLSPLPEDLALVNAHGKSNNEDVYNWTKDVLKNGVLPVVLGGDHSVPFGIMKAVSEHYKEGVGVLHFDAHADMRESYQGFVDSHASIFYNVIKKLPAVTALTQVGIRDFCEEELQVIRDNSPRVNTYFDKQLRKARFEGSFVKLADAMISTLPQHVHVSFDIDGFDPVLCPNTGTPVPGGLSFDEMIVIMEALVRSGKTIVGLDLCEVAPPEEASDEELGDLWDSNVGARVLYKLIGFMLMSHKHPAATPPKLPTPPGV